MKRILGLIAGVCVLGGAGAGIANAQAGAAHAEPAVKVYDETVDARQQIADALATAKKDGKRVLIQWGGNWCPWCLRLNDLMHSNGEIAGALSAHYVLIHVDCGRPNGKNLDLAESYGAAAGMRTYGFPYLTVLDADGKMVVNQESRGLSGMEPGEDKPEEQRLKSGHDATKVLKFLLDNKGQPKAKPAPPVYDEHANAKSQIAAALVSAKRNNRRVLIQWGGNWCPWCIRLNDLMMKDEKVAGVLRAEYDVVHVDAGKPKGKNLDVAAGYRAELEKNGFPYLTVLDGDGKAVANQETAALEVKDDKGESVGVKAGHDPAKVLKFLEMNKAPAVSAEAVLQKGMEEAKARGKNVFLHFGAPWCVWCRRMEAWMARPQIASVLEKDFVDVKIDTQRDTGGQAMLERYSGGKDSGIPWFAFITTDGTVIADSKSPKGNIGFPGDADEIEYFKIMLKKATKKIMPAEIDELLETLKNRPAETPAANGGGGH